MAIIYHVARGSLTPPGDVAPLRWRSEMGVVYCLYSTGDLAPRYVEQTKYTAAKRRRLHLTKALDKEQGRLYDWIREQWRNGYEIDAFVLQDEIIPADLLMFETYWTEQFSGLLNTQSVAMHSCAMTVVGRHVIEQLAILSRGS